MIGRGLTSTQFNKQAVQQGRSLTSTRSNKHAV